MFQFLLPASSVALSPEGHLAEKLELLLMVGQRQAPAPTLALALAQALAPAVAAAPGKIEMASL